MSKMYDIKLPAEMYVLVNHMKREFKAGKKLDVTADGHDIMGSVDYDNYIRNQTSEMITASGKEEWTQLSADTGFTPLMLHRIKRKDPTVRWEPLVSLYCSLKQKQQPEGKL